MDANGAKECLVSFLGMLELRNRDGEVCFVSLCVTTTKSTMINIMTNGSTGMTVARPRLQTIGKEPAKHRESPPCLDAQAPDTECMAAARTKSRIISLCVYAYVCACVCLCLCMYMYVYLFIYIYICLCVYIM